jgi:hypothetical protein
MQYLRQIFKFRTTSGKEFQKGVLTTDYYLGLDAGRSIIAKMKQSNGDKYIQQAQKLGFTLTKSYEEYCQEYQSMIKTLQQFFDGDVANMLAYISEMIHLSATKQQFERCVQLRNIYEYIQTLGQKQEVVFNRPVTGTILSIHQVHTYWVMIFVKFFEGKIIDIIRERIPVEERDKESLVASFKAEMQVKSIKSKVESFTTTDN